MTSKAFELAQLGDAVTVDGSGNVGVGESSPSAKFHVDSGSTDTVALFESSSDSKAYVVVKDSGSSGGAFFGADGTSTILGTGGSTTRMTIDSSGNLLVGKTAAGIANAGSEFSSTGRAFFTFDNGGPLQLNRLNGDGDIIELHKDGVEVGYIGTGNSGDLYIGNSGTGFMFTGGSLAIIPTNQTSLRDNELDLGSSSYRWDDIYATNGTIQTSDRNEKQDIEELTDAEKRVAVAAKGLMRKFRWKDSVAEKGEAARTHFGIIAQDLQAAFAAESLDAGDYAMFISSSWWETQTEVNAVEADEEKGIEAADAYTRTDTYNTEEEAPEGATKKTRLGVRYSELLAFIIGAL